MGPIMNPDSEAIVTEPPATLKPSDSVDTTRGQARLWTSVIMLTLVTLLTFANAIPDALVFDDKAFFGSGKAIQVETLGSAFTRDLWNHPNYVGTLYRPLLLLEFELQNRIFGDWRQGYHLASVLLHLAATLVLFGLLRFLLRRINPEGGGVELYALIAALVFAVHPVHTEVVNSAFNKSSIYVSLAAAGGLWWLLANLASRPLRAWVGFGLIFCLAIMIKESALVLPGIAVAMIVLMTEGELKTRIRRFLPIFWLLIPIAVYFWARAIAVAPEAGDIESSAEDFTAMFQAARVGSNGSPLTAIALFGQGLKMFLWPYPLKLYHDLPNDAQSMAFIAAQAMLGAWAIYLLTKGRPALAAGLAFYYIALFPSLRVISFDGMSVHMAERYLYYPSVGLAIPLAFGLRTLGTKTGKKRLAVISLAVVVALAIVTWERNSHWVGETHLFETEYENGHRGYSSLRILISRHMVDKRYKRVSEICDENLGNLPSYTKFIDSCAISYLALDRKDDAVATWEHAAATGHYWIRARYSLAQFYTRENEIQKAADQFVDIINRVEKPAQKLFYQAELLFALYTNDREKLEKALGLYRETLERDPTMQIARDRIETVNSLLEKMPPTSPVTPSSDSEINPE